MKNILCIMENKLCDEIIKYIFTYIPGYNNICHWCNNILTKEHFSKTHIQKKIPKCLECTKNYLCINEYKTLIKNIKKGKNIYAEFGKKIKNLNKLNKNSIKNSIKNQKLKNHIKMLNKQQINCNICCKMMKKKYWHPYANPYTVYTKLIPTKDFNNHLKRHIEDIKKLKNKCIFMLFKEKQIKKKAVFPLSKKCKKCKFWTFKRSLNQNGICQLCIENKINKLEKMKEKKRFINEQRIEEQNRLPKNGGRKLKHIIKEINIPYRFFQYEGFNKNSYVSERDIQRVSDKYDAEGILYDNWDCYYPGI